MRGARRRWLGIAVGILAVVLLGGCVFPLPPPGVPVPALGINVSFGSDTVTVNAVATNFLPLRVSFSLGTLSGPTTVDTTPPFRATYDTRDLTGKQQKVFVYGADSTYNVMEVANFDITPPNIVFVMVDDLDQTTSPTWAAMPQTKALLADRGLTFTNSFSPDPTCCPARSMLLTGKYPHNTKVWDNSEPDGGYGAFVANNNENDTVATRLQAAGYTTTFAGKYLNGYENDPLHVPPGWDDWFGLAASYYDGFSFDVNHNGTMESFGTTAADYQTDVFRDYAVDVIDEAESDDTKPFLLWLTPSAPHTPLKPAARHAGSTYDHNQMIFRPNYNEPDVSDKPLWLRSGIPSLDVNFTLFNYADYQSRLGSLRAVDDMVSAIVAELSAKDELDNTVLMFTSDNGYNLGAHRLLGKSAPYEESIRVPLVIAGPGIRAGTEPRRIIQPDIMPTLVELATGEAPNVDGRSALPLLRGLESNSWPDDFLIEWRHTGDDGISLDTYAQVAAEIARDGDVPGSPTYRGVRTDRWKYIEWYAGPTHEYELYDLVADPYELTNLIATPAGAEQYASIVGPLATRLSALASCARATCRQ